MRSRKPLAERFWAKVNKTESCWLWTGSHTKAGYGNINVGKPGENEYAHRVAYRLLVGPILDGKHIDHLCRVRDCVNPEHLEAVTLTTNNQRAHEFYRERGGNPNNYGPHSRCKKGHEYAVFGRVPSYGENTTCAECLRLAKEKNQSKVFVGTHCPKGHEYTEDNIYWAKRPTGLDRTCRTCAKDRAKAAYQRKKSHALSRQT